jgi:hypothetical protein
MSNETGPLTDLLRKIIAAKQGKPLNPAWLANAALLELDPLGQTPTPKASDHDDHQSELISRGQE